LGQRTGAGFLDPRAGRPDGKHRRGRPDRAPGARQTTVGAHIDVRHLAATPIGMQVRARAELMGVEGRRLFSIQAWDESELIGEADHERFVVDEAKFIGRVQAKGK